MRLELSRLARLRKRLRSRSSSASNTTCRGHRDRTLSDLFRFEIGAGICAADLMLLGMLLVGIVFVELMLLVLVLVLVLVVMGMRRRRGWGGVHLSRMRRRMMLVPSRAPA